MFRGIVSSVAWAIACNDAAHAISVRKEEDAPGSARNSHRGALFSCTFSALHNAVHCSGGSRARTGAREAKARFSDATLQLGRQSLLYVRYALSRKLRSSLVCRLRTSSRDSVTPRSRSIVPPPVYSRIPQLQLLPSTFPVTQCLLGLLVASRKRKIKS